MEYIIFFIIILIAALVQSTAGFAFSIVFMSIMPLILPYKVCIIVGLICLIPLNTTIALKLKKYINIKYIIFPICSMLIGRTIGIYLLMKFTDDSLMTILSITLIVLSFYFFFFSGKIKIQKSTRNGAIAGLTSGILGGMTNVGGPPLVLYYISSSNSKEEYNANIQISFLCGNIYSIIFLVAYGSFTSNIFSFSIIGTIAVFAGTYIGLRIFYTIKKETLNKIVYILMAVSGTIMLIKN